MYGICDLVPVREDQLHLFSVVSQCFNKDSALVHGGDVRPRGNMSLRIDSDLKF